MLLQWVDYAELPDAHLAALSVPLLNRLWRKISGFEIKTVKSLTSYNHTQKRIQKNLIEFIVNYSKSWMVSKKGKN